MTDEHLMRQWTKVHREFSGDLDRGLARLGRFVSARLHGPNPIGSTYEPAPCRAAKSSDEISTTARAALAGVIACLATTGVLLSLSLLFAADVPIGVAASAPVVAHMIIA